MKKFNPYFSCLLGLCALQGVLSSCEYQEPPLFEEANSGVYFYAEKVEELTLKLNFGDWILNRPEYQYLGLTVRRLGFLSDTPLTYDIKLNPQGDTLMARIDSLPQVVFEPGEYEVDVLLKVACPDTEDEPYAVVLTLEGQDGTKSTDVKVYGEFHIETGIYYSEPRDWSIFVSKYLGDWTFEKHEFFVRNVFQEDFYYNHEEAFYRDNYKLLIDRVRLLPSSSNISVPLTYWNEPGALSRPPYWDQLQNKYVTSFSKNAVHATSTWLRICATEGLTTKTDQAYFTGDENRLREVNKRAFSLMQTVYNELATATGYYSDPDLFHYTYETPIFEDIDYEVSQPNVWSSAYPAVRAMIDAYYGPYSADKLKFMLKVAARHNIPYRWLFPVRLDWDEEAQAFSGYWGSLMDETTWEFYSGDQMAYMLNQWCRQEDSAHRYDFPEVEDPSAGKDKDK